MVYWTTTLLSGVDSPVPDARIGSVSLKLRYATTAAARARGLAGVRYLDPDEGMLFAFATDDTYGFWMKDTLIPLDIVWLDAQGHVVSIAAQVSPATYPQVFLPAAPARYVLELPAGSVDRGSVATGTLFELQKFPAVSE